MSRKRRFVKMFVEDDCSQHVWVQYTDAKRGVDFNLPFDNILLKRSRRGVPWKCLLSYGVRLVARQNPELFPHPVEGAYAEGSTLYVIVRRSPKNARAHPLAVRYGHNFTKTLRQFDQITKAQFIELFGEAGCEIRLKVPRKARNNNGRDRRTAWPQPHRKPTEREAGERRLVGARLRARQAGLLNSKTLGGTRPAA